MSAVADATEEILDDARHAAWRLDLRSGTPDEVELLERSSKSTVFRLAWLHPRRWQIVLKRCNSTSAETQAEAHGGVLPLLPVRAPRLFSSWINDQEGWLAIEDVGDHEPTLDDARQREMVSRWVGELHATSRDLSDLSSLPERSARHYLGKLEEAEAVLANRRESAVTRDEAMRLGRVLDVCTSFKARWQDVEEAVALLPAAFVHADLAPENLRLLQSGSQVEVTAIDWEKSGVGTPFADLAKADLPEYARAADAPLEDVTASAWVARLLRSLSHDWASSRLAKLGRWRRRLERDLAAMP